ncbi:hypothetical protein GCM10010126_50260 [Planomonospora parontospora]|uniref:Uncharacterized protein n=2 Tax=Planomonospora parontospora TaxID=58119 RepID=A0AA37BKP8_9ACTN|nr:hypothetical protein [Planomonospora parontospora]GGK84953.1 hypothetical protein GCM10010126_50260 [Planomonospora parontospora]
MKRLTTGLLAVAATAGAFAFTVPTAAQAAAPAAAPAAAAADRADSWGPYYSSNRRAYARGTVDYEGGSGAYLVSGGGLRVRGYLYDRDYRTGGQGGMCAYAQIQGYRSGGYGGSSGWDRGRTYRHCGTNNYRTIDYDNDYASQARIRVCQVRQYGGRPTYCSSWRYFRDSDYGGYDRYDRSEDVPGYDRSSDRPASSGYLPSISGYTPSSLNRPSSLDRPNDIELEEGTEQNLDRSSDRDHGYAPEHSLDRVPGEAESHVPALNAAERPAN